MLGTYRSPIETGFYYIHHRYYDPQLCRWINADEPENLGANGEFISHNLFAYCLNDPVSGYDPGGSKSTSSILSAIAIVAAIIAALAIGVATYGSAIPALVAVGESVAGGSIAASAFSLATASFLTSLASIAAAMAIEAIDKVHPYTYTVYFLKDSAGDIRYVGRVRDDGYDKRMAYHKATRGLVPANSYKGLPYTVARGLEEIGMIELYTINRKYSWNNQIHGISPVNPRGPLYMISAAEYLDNKAEQELLNLLGG